MYMLCVYIYIHIHIYIYMHIYIYILYVYVYRYMSKVYGTLAAIIQNHMKQEIKNQLEPGLISGFKEII